MSRPANPADSWTHFIPPPPTRRRRQPGRAARFAGLLFLAAGLLVIPTGCIGLAANLMNAVRGYTVKAQYNGLEGKRVAIVTLTDSSQYSDDVAGRLLSQRVSDRLQMELKKNIKLVREDEVQQWRDRNGWDALEFIDIGRGVKADKVVGIEMLNLRLRDGATLYRGRADVTVTVYDTESGDMEFRRTLTDFTYPTNAGQYTSETTEFKFRNLYLGMLADQIARYFHNYDHTDTVALDAAIVTR